MTTLLSGNQMVRTSATLVLLGALLSGPMAMLIVVCFLLIAVTPGGGLEVISKPAIMDTQSQGK